MPKTYIFNHESSIIYRIKIYNENACNKIQDRDGLHFNHLKNYYCIKYELLKNEELNWRG